VSDKEDNCWAKRGQLSDKKVHLSEKSTTAGQKRTTAGQKMTFLGRNKKQVSDKKIGVGLTSSEFLMVGDSLVSQWTVE
jgi:hypothetical protein